MKYTKEDFLKAAKLGEVSMIDANHVVSLLNEVVESPIKRIRSKCQEAIEYLKDTEDDYSHGQFDAYQIVIDSIDEMEIENPTPISNIPYEFCQDCNKDKKRVDDNGVPICVCRSIPYQLCPKCKGDGNLMRYNSPAIQGTSMTPICDVCKGEKIIPQAKI